MALRADDADSNFKKLDWIHFLIAISKIENSTFYAVPAFLQELLMALRADDADSNFKKLDWIHFLIAISKIENSTFYAVPAFLQELLMINSLKRIEF